MGVLADGGDAGGCGCDEGGGGGDCKDKGGVSLGCPWAALVDSDISRRTNSMGPWVGRGDDLMPTEVEDERERRRGGAFLIKATRQRKAAQLCHRPSSQAVSCNGTRAGDRHPQVVSRAGSRVQGGRCQPLP